MRMLNWNKQTKIKVWGVSVPEKMIDSNGTIAVQNIKLDWENTCEEKGRMRETLCYRILKAKRIQEKLSKTKINGVREVREILEYWVPKWKVIQWLVGCFPVSYDRSLPIESVGHLAIGSFQGRRGSDATGGEQYSGWEHRLWDQTESGSNSSAVML